MVPMALSGVSRLLGSPLNRSRRLPPAPSRDLLSHAMRDAPRLVVRKLCEQIENVLLGAGISAQYLKQGGLLNGCVAREILLESVGIQFLSLHHAFSQ